MRGPKGTHPIYWSTFKYKPPHDWTLTPIEKMAYLTKGKLPASLLSQPNGKTVPYLLIDGLTNGNSLYTEDTNLPMINENDTVVVADGSRSGLPIRGVSGALGSTLLRFRSKDEFDPDFLFYLLESLYPYTNTATIGGAVPHLDKHLLARLQVYIPSQNERQSIGKLLSCIDQTMSFANTETLAALRLKTALIQIYFTKGIPGYHNQFSRSKWFTSPKSWQTKLLRDLADVKAGFTMGRDLSGFETVKMPYVTVVNVQEGYFDLDNISSVEIKISETSTGTLKRDDVLMTEGGDRDKLGRGAIWSDEINPCAFQNHIFRVRFRSEEYRPKLFHYLIQSWQVKRYFYSHAKQTSNLCTINSRELNKLPISIPDPDEQDKMIEILEIVDAAIRTCKTKINALILLKKSLLQTLLTGKVRIKSEGIK